MRLLHARSISNRGPAAAARAAAATAVASVWRHHASQRHLTAWNNSLKPCEAAAVWYHLGHMHCARHHQQLLLLLWLHC
jgi:hypothetical protein